MDGASLTVRLPARCGQLDTCLDAREPGALPPLWTSWVATRGFSKRYVDTRSKEQSCSGSCSTVKTSPSGPRIPACHVIPLVIHLTALPSSKQCRHPDRRPTRSARRRPMAIAELGVDQNRPIVELGLVDHYVREGIGRLSRGCGRPPRRFSPTARRAGAKDNTPRCRRSCGLNSGTPAARQALEIAARSWLPVGLGEYAGLELAILARHLGTDSLEHGRRRRDPARCCSLTSGLRMRAAGLIQRRPS